jgi:3-methylfumaryl-CoA hydratase
MTDGERPEWARGWEPVTESRTADVADHPCSGLAALLDLDPGRAGPGEPLPPLWHWVALSEWPRASTIGPDGHPKTGALLPQTPYPRRMWVGTRVEIHEAPKIGSRVQVDRRVEDLTEKSGRQGSFALVTVRTTIRSLEGAPLVTEDNQLAYRAAAPRATPAVDLDHAGTDPAVETVRLDPPRWLTQEAAWDWRFRPTSVMLMMFSAVTGNAHRIHYDAPYAQGTEGYPDLLVHGPLMAMVLAEVARRERPDDLLAAISFRAQRPMYLGSTAGIWNASPDRATGGASDQVVHLELAPTGPDAPAPPHMTAEATYR